MYCGLSLLVFLSVHSGESCGAQSSLCWFIYIYIDMCVCVFRQRAGSICLFFFNQHCNNFVYVTYLILGSYPVLCVKSRLPVLPLTVYVDWVSLCCILHTVSLMHSEWCITCISGTWGIREQRTIDEYWNAYK